MSYLFAFGQDGPQFFYLLILIIFNFIINIIIIFNKWIV
jgi:hypothetical protein